MIDTNPTTVDIYPGWGPDASTFSLKEMIEQWKLYDFFVY